MTEIQKLRKRLEDIAREVDKYNFNTESLKEELGAITKLIYQEVDKASKEERYELDNLIMLKNIIKSKIEKRL